MRNRSLVSWSAATVPWLLIAIPVWLTFIHPKAVAVDSPLTERVGRGPFLTGTLIAVEDPSEGQLSQLELAVSRFQELDLQLPPLDVRFFDSIEDCDGLVARFSAGTTPWSVRICSPDLEWVYEHELAHAWEQENLTDAQRLAFMERRGLSVWAGHDVPWNERGKEWVAVVIQQGLAGPPLSPVLPSEIEWRLAAFERLTGRLAPVLAEWLRSREVACENRPTELSRIIADRSGRTCVESRSVSVDISR